ncbi:MAG TPA: TonB-dependent receptor [Longimicrobiaceae bacterium]|jgi:hypothetical protein|nr:TonB-dependent receptor [Longimicrobiaceae bacterium]
MTKPLFAIAVALVCASAPLAAQDTVPPAGPPARTVSVHGRVLSGETGAPVRGATVRLGSALPARTTDSTGVFIYDVVPEGTYSVTVTHPSYGSRAGSAVLTGGGELEMELRINPNVVALSPLVARARAQPRVPYDRHALATGERLITREDMEKFPVGDGQDLANVLRATIPNLQVGFARQGSQLVGISFSYHGSHVTVFLDGMRLDASQLLYMGPPSMEGAEFYPHGTMNAATLSEGAKPVLVLHSRVH